MQAVRLVITGRVQGVGYRVWLQREAMRAGVIGWVRNRRDGTVEAAIGGRRDQIEAMLDTARRGPPGSRVDEILRHHHGGELPQRFSILPTA